MRPHASARLRTYGASLLSTRASKRAPKWPPVESWSWTPYDPAGAMVTAAAPDYPQAIETNYRPTRKRQKVALVFSCGWNTAPLLEHLDAAELSYFYLDFDEFTALGKLTWTVGSGGSQKLSMGEATLDLADVAAVIWSPPEHMFAEPAQEREFFLYVHRWRQVLRDLRLLIRADAVWLPSHPLNGSQEWQNKLSELAVAEGEGLAVPATLCTNDPEAALAFVKRVRPGKVMFREYTRAASLFPLVFIEGAPKLRDFEDLRTAPCVFQEYIEKEFEVRAIMVGDEVFACRIDSQASKTAAIDWRAYDNARVRWDRMKLPKRVRDALVRIGKALDLKFASFDLIKAKDGKYYFLEVNRPGATYWLLPFVGLDVSKEIVTYVASRFAIMA